MVCLLKMNIKQFFGILIVMVLFSSCTTKPEPIAYGKDECVFCKMKAMNNRYGAEIITTKGKIYKFDATECMIDFINANNIEESGIKIGLIVDFANPGTFVDVKNAWFFISADMPSPMGANLSSFSNENSVNTISKKHQGKILKWTEAKEYVKNLDREFTKSY